MASKHDQIAQLRKELTEMFRLGMINDTVFAAAMTYAETHRQEMLDDLSYSSVSDVADSVVDVARMRCGKCG